MKIINYILKLGFAYILSVVMLTEVPKAFFNKADELKNETFEQLNLTELSLVCLIPSDTSYVKLKGTFSNKIKFEKIFRIEDNKDSFNNLIALLHNEKIISSKYLSNVIPLHLNESQLKSFQKVNAKFIHKVSLEKLTIDGVYVVGSKVSVIKIGFIYLFGVVLFLLGLLCAFSSCFITYCAIKVYNQTGELEELPNSIDAKIDGLKFLFGLKNKD